MLAGTPSAPLGASHEWKLLPLCHTCTCPIPGFDLKSYRCFVEAYQEGACGHSHVDLKNGREILFGILITLVMISV